MPWNLIIRVVEIKGRCPVYRVGDMFKVVGGYRLATDIPLCLHGLVTLMPYYVALSRGINPVELGLGREGRAAYVQCPDPCERTGGGTVVFKIEQKEEDR
ncbi:MAG: TIGR04076 family protein [Bacillota bacterium]